MRYSNADLFFGVVSPSLVPTKDNPQGSGVGVSRVPGHVHSSVGLRTILLGSPTAPKTRHMVLPTSRGGVPWGGRALPGTFLEPHVTIEGSVVTSPARPLNLELKTRSLNLKRLTCIEGTTSPETP